MRSSLTLLALAAGLACAAAQQSLAWIGQTFDGATVTYWTLDATGAPTSKRGSVAMPAGTVIGVDLFRCLPYGNYCQFVAHDSTGAASLYNTTLDGALVGRVALPAGDRVVSLHVDHTTGTSIFTALAAGGGAAVKTVADDGAAQTLVDLSRFMPAGSTIKTGGATQCSNLQLMWVCVSNSSYGTLYQIDLKGGYISSYTPLTFPCFDAMWADCAEFVVSVDTPGGTVFDAASGTLQYGKVSNIGDFSPLATGQVPAGLAPNGLLTFADVFDSTYQYAAPLYPAGAAPGPAPAKGQIAFFTESGPDMAFQPVSYYLAGAALA